MTKEEFDKKFEGLMPSGKLKQIRMVDADELGKPHPFHHDTSHDVSFVSKEGDIRRFGTFTHADWAALTEQLVNAYLAGELVWAEDQAKLIKDMRDQLEATNQFILVATTYLSLITCKKCGGVAVNGYHCIQCGDDDPTEPPEEGHKGKTQ